MILVFTIAFIAMPNTVFGAKNNFKHTVTIVGGTNNNKATTATYKTEENVIITADGLKPEGKIFAYWSSDEEVVFADEKSIETNFEMPNEDITITAHFQNDYKVADNKSNKIKLKKNKNIIFSALAVIAIAIGAFLVIKKHNINKQYK